VIDHLGGFDAKAGPDQPGFRVLADLVASGRVWVKLSAYRNTVGLDPELARPFQQRLLQAHPERLVWGSDWPHLRITPVPDVADRGQPAGPVRLSARAPERSRAVPLYRFFQFGARFSRRAWMPSTRSSLV